MNRKIILSLAFVATLFITSCKKELEPQPSSETPLNEATTDAIPAPADAQTITPQAPTTSAPVQTVQAPTSTSTKTAPGMNPPHGQPGHRCDIAVGAPLNSPKGQTPTTTPAPTPQPASTIVTTPQAKPAAVTPTAPGMNPPHGQPGHKCEIAVGAPLPTE